ncbi:ATP synthase F1 subunit gamma [Mycoplasma sp. ATU-Cv-703]|uniref:ATP synthase F1 subunit gamma n=1 Tax=Mycoplasma sp. ATU-Cv-703 TaxID=2498595 RepID=UPI000FDE9EDF
MPSLQEIKSRINSVVAIKKITRAMQLVATSKLQKLRRHFSASDQFFASLEAIFWPTLRHFGGAKTLFGDNPDAPVLWLVITSDLGLSGSYNVNVLKLAQSQIGPQDRLIVVGTKGVRHFETIGRSVDLAVSNLGENITYRLINQIVDRIGDFLLEQSVKDLRIVSTKYINSISFEPLVWSLAEATRRAETSLDEELTEFEPKDVSIVHQMMPFFIAGLVFDKLVESKVSEMASRRIAMENATDNAAELIDTLTVRYNQARQAAITQEISEIVAGSQN